MNNFKVFFFPISYISASNIQNFVQKVILFEHMKYIYDSVLLGLLSEGHHDNRENPQYLINSYFKLSKLFFQHFLIANNTGQDTFISILHR